MNMDKDTTASPRGVDKLLTCIAAGFDKVSPHSTTSTSSSAGSSKGHSDRPSKRRSELFTLPRFHGTSYSRFFDFRNNLTSMPYTLGDHAEYLHLMKEDDVDYCDVTYLLVDSGIPRLAKDYPSPIPPGKLTTLYFGLERTFRKVLPNDGDGKDLESWEPIPVRTMTFRIRPDTESGKVIDALKFAVEDREEPCVILKRQDGHFQCAVIPNYGAPYLVDAQLCVARTSVLERQLLLRVYHTTDDEEACMEVERLRSQEHLQPPDYRDDQNSKDKASCEGEKVANGQKPYGMYAMNLYLKEASSLLQSIRSISKTNDATNPLDVPSPKKTIKETFAYMLENHESVPSVQECYSNTDQPCFPSLSSDDSLILQFSWPLLLSMWIGLIKSQAAFHTLERIPMVSPVVLDSLYQSQIRQLSRDAMLGDLELKTEELRKQERRAENIYENFLLVLELAWQKYDLPIPQPLPPRNDFETVESSRSTSSYSVLILALIACNQKEYDDNDNPESVVDDVVGKVFAAFADQDEKEKQQCLNDRHAEIMKRIMNLEIHQRDLLAQLENPETPHLCKFAKEFCQKAQAATNTKGRINRLITPKVPLLELSTTRETCYITATRMLIVPNGMFAHTTLLDLKAVEFEVTCITNPTYLHILNDQGEIIYKYRPPINISQLKLFLETLKVMETAARRLSKQESDVSQLRFQVHRSTQKN